MDSNVTAGATYSYQVEAFNRHGRVALLERGVGHGALRDPGGPDESGGQAAASPASVSLSWTDNATNATAYTVERSVGTTGDWTVIASNLAATATSYTDSNVTAGATYSYQVEAFNVTAGSPSRTWRRPPCLTRPRRPRPISRPRPPLRRRASACRGPTTPPTRRPTWWSGASARRATGPSSPATFGARPRATRTAT